MRRILSTGQFHIRSLLPARRDKRISTSTKRTLDDDDIPKGVKVLLDDIAGGAQKLGQRMKDEILEDDESRQASSESVSRIARHSNRELNRLCSYLAWKVG